MTESESRKAGRQRPLLHFTPLVGWMNDPHGVVYDGTQYHLFYQYVPNSTEWSVAINWGHAVSADLVKWQEVGVALEPLDTEAGCWSGSIVFADDGTPTMFYTQPSFADWGRGRVVVARGSADLQEWQRIDDAVVIDGPPADSYHDFRDPNVRRNSTGDGWRMVLGAGITDFGGCALQYSSRDLQQWQFDGVLTSRSSAESAPFPTGTTWECPQFIQVDGSWVLIFSAMDGADVSGMAYAVGDYDGKAFTARHWGRFAHTWLPYATTTFRDNQGRPCAISWLREQGGKAPIDSKWSGAQSLTAVMRLVGDQLRLEPHPDLQPYLIQRDDVVLGEGSINFDAGSAWRLVVGCETNGRVQVQVAGANPWVLSFDSATGRLAGQRGSEVLFDVALNAGPGTLDVIVDADLIEVFHSASEGFTAAHIPANERAELRISGANALGQLRR